jgi:predicted dehydrogenase
MEKVRVGIIGLGWVAQVFHLPILKSMPSVEIIAVCDRDKTRVRFIAEKFGIKTQYTDHEALLAAEDLDAVIVCTSTDAHLPVALAALQAGRDVFVEKPIARTLNEASDMAEAARKHKRKLMVGMNHRFRPDTTVLKDLVMAGELGKIYYVKAGWFKKLSSNQPWITRKDKSGGGVVLDLGIVMLDLSLWILGFPAIDRVSARTYSTTTRSVEDSSMAFFHAKNGVTIFNEVSWSLQSAEEFYYCDFYGVDGSARINPLRIHKELHGNLVNVTPARMETPHNLHRKSYENELAHFVAAVQNSVELISTADEAVQRMKIAAAIYESSRKGRDVVLKQ